eukprot:672256-Pyramimonas_sp.AAC.1
MAVEHSQHHVLRQHDALAAAGGGRRRGLPAGGGHGPRRGRREGWKLAPSEPVRTEKGGLSSGVGIGVRAHIGMGSAPKGPKLSRDRAIAKWVNCGVPGAALAASAHLSSCQRPRRG